LKNFFKQQAISVFISPPSIKTLEERLRLRGTETEETLKVRLEKASYEMTFKNRFDYIVVNDILDKAKDEIIKIVGEWINK